MKQPIMPEPEQPKRQPVPIEEPEPAVVVEQTTPPKRQPPPIDEDGYRHCARAGCDEMFKPLSRNPKDQDVTEFYCSTACAEIEFRKSQGLAPRSTTPATAKRGNNGENNPEHDARKEQKYGPVRTIVDVISEKSGRVTVKLDCGHQASVKKGRKQARCRKCKAVAQGSAPAVSTRPKRQPVPPPAPATSVKREPVKAVQEFVERGQRAQAAVNAAIKTATAKKPTAKAAKKPKRAPVRATKKSARKKGKR